MLKHYAEPLEVISYLTLSPSWFIIIFRTFAYCPYALLFLFLLKFKLKLIKPSLALCVFFLIYLMGWLKPTSRKILTKCKNCAKATVESLNFTQISAQVEIVQVEIAQVIIKIRTRVN